MNQSDKTKFLTDLENIIKEGEQYGIDVGFLLEKIQRIQDTIKSRKVRIVLMGSFSDGKTSALAGLLGRTEDSMKIDVDESSDDLHFYDCSDLKDGFEIVDTPGLFGSKEKEYNGSVLKYSERTKKYLSEANIIIYVCNAITPLKDSHAEVMKWVMRDMNKLSNTIFVLNKMDEAGYDLTDADDYERGVEIKRQAMILRLRDVIGLTESEEKELKICCVAVDPKSKGLAYWQSRPEDYAIRSRINELSKLLDAIVQKSDSDKLISQAVITTALDVVRNIDAAVDVITGPVSDALTKTEESCEDIKLDLSLLKKSIMHDRNDAIKRLDNLKSSLNSDIKTASLETFEGIIDSKIGIEDGKVSFYVVLRNIDIILEEAQCAVSSKIDLTTTEFERVFIDQDNLIEGTVKKGLDALKGVKVSNKDVLMVRNLLFKGHKFKPYGAVKVAKNVSKGTTVALVVVGIGIDLWQGYKKLKATKEMVESKDNILKQLDTIFASIYRKLTDENFIENFAPQYTCMSELVTQRETELVELKHRVNELKEYKLKIKQFMISNTEDVEYKEI